MLTKWFQGKRKRVLNMSRVYSKKWNDNFDVYRTRSGKKVDPWFSGWIPR